MLSEKQIALMGRIDDLVSNAWENQELEGSMAFEDFIPQLYSLKENHAQLDTIAQKLYEIQSTREKHEPNMSKCRHIAQQILDL